MARKLALLVAVSLLFAFPMGIAEEGESDGPDEDATWGLCTAQEASEDGDGSSNGTVSATPAFNDTSEEDCDEAEHPANRTLPDRGGPEDRPGAEDNPGEDRDEPEDRPDDRGDEADDRSEQRDDRSDEGSENRP